MCEYIDAHSELAADIGVATGSFFYCDNTVYEGEWSQNEKHGSGVWREHNGDEMETTFVHNRILDKESGEYVASIAHMQGKVSNTGDLPLAEAEDQLNVGSMFSETGKNAPDSATIQKVQDLINRHRVPLTEIYRYYAALGESVGEAMYTLSCHQFCQLCKDCQLPNKMFPLAFCDALFTEQCQQVAPQPQRRTLPHTHALPHCLTHRPTPASPASLALQY